MKRYISEAGFTLIEALIAFVVMTVGILGALLFHSTLVKDTADNKARLEAIKIAEQWVEQHRQLSTSAAFDSNVVSLVASPATASYTGINASYVLTASATLVSDALISGVPLYSISLNVADASTTPSFDPVSLSAYIGWLDPTNEIAPEDAGGGEAGYKYSGDIPVPTGTLKELPRLEVVSMDEINNADEKREQDGFVVYKNTLDGQEVIKVAIEIEDGVFVQLAQLGSFNDELFSISGRIYNHHEDNRAVDHRFGPVFGLSASTASESYSDFDTVTITDSITGESSEFVDNIIDVRPSAGASCIVGRFANRDSAHGLYANYLCVAGTGWNGNIKPVLRTYDGDRSTDILIDGLVCAPGQRNYRYFILSTENITAASNAVQSVGNFESPSVTIQKALSDGGFTSSGQSGLVRFYSSAASVAAAPSGQGVLWGQYFWQNPNYIIPPFFGDQVYLETPSVARPTYVDGNNFSMSLGYKAPAVVSVASVAYQTNYPGDVAHQNFYLAKKGNGNSAWDCSDVLGSYTGSVSPISPAASTSIYPEIAGQTGFALHSHLLTYGYPGFEESGYLPPKAGVPFDSNYSYSDFNKFNEDLGNGSVILGYTLATEPIIGSLTLPLIGVLPSDLILAGNPQPILSITCPVNVENPAISSLSGVSYATYSFSCGVPPNWVGNILAYDNPSDGNQVSRCDVELEASELGGNGENIVSSALSSIGELNVTTSNLPSVAQASGYSANAIEYFFNTVLATPSSASASQFSTLATKYFVMSSVANASVEINCN